MSLWKFKCKIESYLLAFAFWAPVDEGDEGKVSQPPGDGVDAII